MTKPASHNGDAALVGRVKKASPDAENVPGDVALLRMADLTRRVMAVPKTAVMQPQRKRKPRLEG